MAEDADANGSEVIPSIELKGTRAEKLRQLERLIERLEHLHRRLAGDTRVPNTSIEGPSPGDRIHWRSVHVLGGSE